METIYNIIKTEVVEGSENVTEKSVVASFNDKETANLLVKKLDDGVNDWVSYSVEAQSISSGFIEVGDIEWDVDDEEDLETLPKLVFIPNGELNPYDDLEDTISDWLSDTYGFCHKGFTYEEY